MVTHEKLRTLAMALTEVTEEPHFEKSSFRVRKKIFCTLDQQKGKAVLKLNENDQSVFCAYDPEAVYPVAGAWGKKGWTIFELSKSHEDLFADALNTSYRTVAPKKLAELHLPPEEDFTL